MMMAVLLLGFIIYSNLESKILVNVDQDHLTSQSDQYDTLPIIILEKLEKSKNHLESQLKYDSKNKMIDILTYQRSDDGVINDTALYYSKLVESTLVPIKHELGQGHLLFKFTMIEHQNEIVVGFSNINNIIMVSSNYGKNWRLKSAPINEIKKILIHSQNSHDIALVDKQNSEVKRSSMKILESFENEPYLLKTNYDTQLPSYVLAEAIKYGEIGDILWAVTKEKNKAKLYLILNDGEVKQTSFPAFLNPINFYVSRSNSQIFTIVINETNNILLYSASLKDLSFVRIGENLRIIFK
ncbi:hypothetical protein HZS_2566 [Henneguya salminicola]|nr:hypothetical protein HZS_2566 [Henneguya salminicola]